MRQQVRTIRWKLFGHVLRLPTNTPPQYLMDLYMNTAEHRICKQGGQYWTLPRLINKELRLIGRTFNCKADLEEMRKYAADRNGWILMRQEIEAKWARQEKVNEAKRKLNLLLPPARTEREEEREEEGQARIPTKSRPEQSEKVPLQCKKARREQLILRITKRSIEAVMKTTTDEDETETERMWKKKRIDKWEWNHVKQVTFI